MLRDGVSFDLDAAPAPWGYNPSVLVGLPAVPATCVASQSQSSRSLGCVLGARDRRGSGSRTGAGADLMWPRYLEQLLGLWLAAGPYVFGYATLPGRLWLHDLICAVLVIALSMLTHLSALRRLHLALLPVATWLVVHGWWQSWTSPGAVLPAYQNWIVVGLSLAMLAVVPSRASQPTASRRS